MTITNDIKFFLGNDNNFETMEECILNCSGPDLGDRGDEILHRPTPFESFSSRLQRFKSKFNERNRGSFVQPNSQGMIFCIVWNLSFEMSHF